MKHSPRRYTTPRMGQYSTQKKNRNLSVHTVELSTAVVKVDVKVINAKVFFNRQKYPDDSCQKLRNCV